MKNQALFSSKDKSKKLKCRLLQFLFGALRLSFANGIICDEKIEHPQTYSYINCKVSNHNIVIAVSDKLF